MMKKVSIFLSVIVMTVIMLGSVATPVYAVSGDITSGIQATGAGSNGNPTDLNSVIKSIVNVMLFIIGALAVIMIIYSGIRFATSGGNASTVTSARQTLIYAVVGLVIAILAYAIVNWVTAMIGG